MKSIYILRHAKSDWSALVESDHERPLNKRGRSAAELVGTFLRVVDQIPDRVVSSTATRAQTTARLAAEAGSWDREIELEKSLYGASTDTILELIRANDETFISLLLVSHEPSCSSAISELVGGCRARFPTAAMVRIDFNVDAWNEIEAGSGVLIWFVTPKLLKKVRP